MKTSKLLLAVVSATVLLGALVTSASANHLEISSQTSRATWTRWNFRSGSGTFECEVVLSGSFHSRTIAKTAGSLIGYITEASVTRCTRNGMTVNRESLPWHRTYKGFSGTLPNITGIEETIVGAEWRFREAAFGLTCTIRREKSSTILTYAISSGVVTSASVSGTSPCEGSGLSTTFTLEGSTERVENGSGARLTIRLI